MVRLDTLEQEINTLKTKHASNSMATARAEETATMARDKANEAKQVSDSWVASLNAEAQDKDVLSVFMFRF